MAIGLVQLECRSAYLNCIIPLPQGFGGDQLKVGNDRVSDLNDRAYCRVGGYSVVHFSGLYLLARALATGDATVILQTFQHNSFASEPARE